MPDPRAKQARVRISFFVHDLASNPVGRVVPLARAIADLYDVEILGLLLSGSDVYEPYRGLFPYRTIRTSIDIGDVLLASRRLAQMASGEIVYACKPLLTTLGPALLASGFGRRKPLLLDVEDDEWIPFGRSPGAFIGRDLVRGWRHATAWKYTRALHPAVRCAAGITVVSTALQRRYGGVRLLHGPDEQCFDPDRPDLDPSACRTRFGLPADVPLALFSGLPRPHKGWDVLLAALEQPEAREWHLVLAGATTNPDFARAAARLPGRVHRVGFVPYPDQPALLAAATAVPVPQLPTPFARAQVPAKLLDALAMRCPVVASRVGDLGSILGDGNAEPRGWVVDPDSPAQLAAALRQVDHDASERRRRTGAARAWFLREASASVARERLDALIRSVRRDDRTSG